MEINHKLSQIVLFNCYQEEKIKLYLHNFSKFKSEVHDKKTHRNHSGVGGKMFKGISSMIFPCQSLWSIESSNVIAWPWQTCLEIESINIKNKKK